MVIDRLVKSLINGKEGFKLMDDCDINTFLRVEITNYSDGSFQMTQPHLISGIIQYCGIDPVDMNGKVTPVGKPLIHRDLNRVGRKHSWNYQSAVVMLGYLQNTSRPELAMPVHQCVRFNNSPMFSHERVITRICCYLLQSRDKGLIYKRKNNFGLQCYENSDFEGGWTQADLGDAETVMSRTGYVIIYAGCPIIWCSKLQTEIALSTIEDEYIDLSQAIREVIPIISLMKELDSVLEGNTRRPDFYCQVFEDN